MAIKSTFMVPTHWGAMLEAEAHSSRKMARLIVTRLAGSRRTITHKASGWSMASLLPETMRAISDLIAFAEALEAFDHPAWAIIDRATPQKGFDQKNLSGRDVDHLRDFAAKARDMGLDIVVKRYTKA